MLGRAYHALAMMLPLSLCHGGGSGGSTGIPQAILRGCPADIVFGGQLEIIGNVRFRYLTERAQTRGGTLRWEPQADGAGIVRLVTRDALTGQATRMSFAVEPKPASGKYPACADGVTLVTGIEADGARADGFELEQALDNLFRHGIEEGPASTRAMPAAAPPAPPPAPAAPAETSADRREMDEDNDYYTALAPYRDQKVRVATADGSSIDGVTLGTLIDHYQNERAEVRIDPNNNSYLEMQLIQHTATSAETTRLRFTLGADPGQGWTLDTVTVDGRSRPLYSRSASPFAGTPDAYLIDALKLSTGNMQ